MAKKDSKLKNKNKGSGFRFGGLFKSIFLAAIISMAIPLIIVSVTTVNSVRSNLEKSSNENLQQIATEKMSQLDSSITAQLSLDKAVAADPYLSQKIADQFHSGTMDEVANAELMNYMGTIFSDGGDKYENFFITVGSTGVADGVGGATLHDVTGEGWYDAALSGNDWIGNAFSPVTSLPVLEIGTGIKDPQTGEVVGGLLSALKLETMTGSIVSSLTDENMKVLVINSDGLVLASEDESELLTLDFSTENDTTKAIVSQIGSSSSGNVTFTLNGVSNIGAYSSNSALTTLVYMPVSAYMSQINSMIAMIVVVAIICFFIAAFIITLVSMNIIRPLSSMVSLIEGYGNADFSKPVPESLIRRKDEIGNLANSMAKMQATIKDVFTNIINETDSVAGNLNTSNEQMSNLADRINNVNNLTADRAAEMEETAASTELINQNTQTIRSSVENISNETVRGIEIADGISKRASKLKSDAQESQKNVTSISLELRDKLEEAVEQSKEVNKIEELSVAIMDIAEETNLLSLNASIEAARAGEAGKGFAVVAEQIGKLAENSQETVTQIQNVTKNVIVAVNNLAENSQRTVKFIDENVIGDYQTMVDLGEQYYADADTVRQLVETINSSADELNATIQTITSSIGEISIANSEGANGITNISQNTSDILNMSTDVSNIMDEVSDSTKKLKDTVNKLTV